MQQTGLLFFSSSSTLVMKIQDYVKYLMCVVPACLGHFSPNIDEKDRGSRSVFDILVGRFKPCGGCLCGRSNHASRFLGGEYTEKHEFPWLAHILVQSSPLSLVLMTGVLINDRYVLTSASLLRNVSTGGVKVSLGEHDRCVPGVSEVLSAVEITFLHPEFDIETRSNDLALLRLARPVKFEKRLAPVCLPNPGSEYLGQVGTLVGWTEGIEKEPNKRFCTPRKLGLPILGKKECSKTGSYHVLNHDSGCMGIIGTNNIICSNDVGTSVLYRSYTGIYDLIGVIPDINNCELKTGTAFYTKVGPHLNWILQNTKDACYCTK